MKTYIIGSHKYDYPKCKMHDMIAHFTELSKDKVLHLSFDIETNVVDDLTLRKVYVMTFYDNIDTRYLVDVPRVTNMDMDILIRFMNVPNKNIVYIIHNAMFEYTVLKQCYGLEIENFYDTYLTQKIVYNGINFKDSNPFSLAYLVKLYIGIELDKSFQTSYDGKVLSAGQLEYAFEDVMHLGHIKNKQASVIEEVLVDYDVDLTNILRLEHEALKGLGDIMCNGMYFDEDKWMEAYHWAKPQQDLMYKELSKIVSTEESMKVVASRIMELEQEIQVILEHPIISIDTKNERIKELNSNLSSLKKVVALEDTFIFNCNSTPQKKKLLTPIYGDVDVTVKGLKTLLDKETDLDKRQLLTAISLKDKDKVLEYALKILGEDKLGNTYTFDDNGEMIMGDGLDMYYKRGTCTINWNSSKQRLLYLQLYVPELTSTKKEELADYMSVEIIELYKKYIDCAKLTGTYGKTFLDNINADGRVRIGFIDQYLATGRISTSKPNLQQIPKDEDWVFKRYKYPFIVKEGYKFITSDYSAQEVCVLASLAGEQVLIDAIKEGVDLHLNNAHIIWQQEFIDKADPDCAFVANRKKCSCKQHKIWRQYAKTAIFLSVYGGGATKLSKNLGIPKQMAQDVLDRFFNAFPSLKNWFAIVQEKASRMGTVATNNVYPTVRFVDEEGSDPTRINRLATNNPIQGTSAQMMKIAIVLVRRWLKANPHIDAKMICVVHDDLCLEAREDQAVEVAKKVSELQAKAGSILLNNDLISAEAVICDSWAENNKLEYA